VLLSLVTSPVLSRLDYGSATLVGVPAYLIDRLQSILHAAASRLVNGSRKYDHVSSLLRDLHWLRVPERIVYRLAVLVFRCRNHSVPVLDEGPTLGCRRRLPATTEIGNNTPTDSRPTSDEAPAPSAIVRLKLPALVCGTLYHLQSSLRHLWPCLRRI